MSLEDIYDAQQEESIFSIDQSDLADIQFPFLPQECSPSYRLMDLPGSTDDPTFLSGYEGFDQKAIERFLELDSIPIESLIPSQGSPIVKVPSSGALESGTQDELPAISEQQIMTKSPDNQPEIPGQQPSIDKEKLTKHVDLATESFDDPDRVIQLLGSLTTEEIRKALKASKGTVARRMNVFWKRYHPLLESTAEKAQTLVNRRGVKMKRRKRMGSDIPAIEKKEIRAQRNRERSQALRRHHKQRLLDLERVGQEMKACNVATRSIINCLLEDESSLAALNKYLAANECTELLLGFLSE